MTNAKLVKPMFVHWVSKHWNVKAKRTMPDWTEVVVDSLLEWRLFDLLYNKDFQKRCWIKHVSFQAPIELIKPYEIDGVEFKKKWKLITTVDKVQKERWSKYFADFVIVLESWEQMILDSKWRETDVFKLKKKLVESIYKQKVITLTEKVIDKWFFEQYLISKKNGKK